MVQYKKIYAATGLLQIPNEDRNEDKAKIQLIDLDEEFELKISLVHFHFIAINQLQFLSELV